MVAPFAGAWIEMACICGTINPPKVAPFAGAWIEIGERGENGESTDVAPFAGAWIEIILIFDLAKIIKRRSLRGSVD